MACEALIFAEDRKKIMLEYLEKGVRVCGKVQYQWFTVETTSSETESVVKKAIVSYEAPADSNHYQMNLIPLDEKTEMEITETGVVQVLILEDYPASGLPQSYIDPDAFSLSLFGRFLLFLAGCGFSAFWTAIPALIIAEDNNTPNLILMYVLIVVGIFLMFTIVILVRARSHRRNLLLNFSKKMEGQSIDMQSIDMQVYNPLTDLDQKIRQVFFSCIKYICSNEDLIQEEAAAESSGIPLLSMLEIPI